MTELLSALETPSDAELISRVRGGDVAAYGELFERHVEAARRLSRQLVRGPDADDLVSEAFAKVLQVLQGGGGPDVAFRAYLLTSVRRLHVDRVRAGSRLQTTDDMSQFDPGVPFRDTAVAGFESGAAAKAFASLPERWQLVLWHLEVEGQKPADIAPMLGMSANSVSALAYRAREGLRQAFLTMHLSDISETECRWVNEHLGGYVRKGLSKRDSTKVEAHLDGCRRCTAMYLELTEVNSNLRALIGPLLLGGAATGYLASGGSAGAGGLFGLASSFSKLKETVVANVSTATAGAVAAGVAAAAVAGFAVMQGNGTDTVIGADRPIAVGTPAVPGAPTPSAGATDGAPGAGVQNPVTPGELPLEDLPDAPAGSPAAQGPLAPGVIGPSSGPGTNPSGEPGTAPGTQPGGQPGTGPGAQPGGEPGAGPGTQPGGPGTQPGGDPGTEPGGQPGTGPGTEPGGQPGDNPGESPTEPSDEPTKDPGDPEPSPGPTIVSTDLSVTGTPVVTSASLTFSVAGSPIPDQVSVALSGDFGGITLTKSAQCQVDESGTSAVCTPLPDIATAGSAAVRAFGAPASAAVITLPWEIADRTRSYHFTVDVAVVGNYVDPHPENNRLSIAYPASEPDPEPTNPPHDFAVTSLTSSEETEPRTFELTANVGALPAGVNTATFMLSGATDFSVAGPENSACTVNGSTISCTGLPSGKFQLRITVTLPDTTAHDVALEIAVPADYVDEEPNNNTSRSVTLDPADPAPSPKADLALTATRLPDGNSGKGRVNVNVSGSPSDAALTLTVTYDADDLIVTAPPGISCETGVGSVSCALSGGAAASQLAFGYELKDREGHEYRSADVTFSVSAYGYEDENPDDNTKTVKVERHETSQGSAGTSIVGDAIALLRQVI